MSHLRDAQMFAVEDGYNAGRREAYTQATHSFSRQIGELLGVESSLFGDLNFSDVNERLVALTAVATAVEARLKEEHARQALLVSPDPKDTAVALLAEQRDLSQIFNEGHSSLSDFEFGIDDNGGAVVRMQAYHFGPLRAKPITDEWVSERLLGFGVDKDMIECGQIASVIQETVVSGAQNG